MIRLEHLSKYYDTFGGPLKAVDDVSFEVPEGEICVLLGPSGCGKTTTMKMINRLIEPTNGKIHINGRDTSRSNPIELRRSIGYVIQQIGLFPNKTIADNICVVPDLLGWDRKKSRKRAAELLELVALDPAIFMQRYPKELSGGQQQRVGVIRALAADPPVMLMDEPFGAIDPINREVIQDEFLLMQKAIRKTIVFVSHDLDEAVKMADKIAIFRAGKLEQFASPDQLLARPANAFIESFLGSDRALKRLSLVLVVDTMLRRFDAVREDEPMAKVREMLRATGQPAIVVVNSDGRPAGMIAANNVPSGEEAARKHVQPLRASLPITTDLRSAAALMFAHDMPVMPCVDGDGKLQGVLTYRAIVARLSSGEAPS